MLIEGLSKNKGLKYLNLSHNLISDTGIGLLSYGLAKNKKLKIIDLSSNRISHLGGLALVQSLKYNYSLEGLIVK